ncbi:MAG: DUF1214 domain-containing protein [Rhizomicrobium sp.]
MARIEASLRGSARIVRGWEIPGSPIGTYGADYLRRAAIAHFGLGANLPEDAVYPTIRSGADGGPLDSARPYVVHFEKDELPPARAFWSLTLYNDKQFFAANPIDRYAIGDRDRLALNPDGSLDIRIQARSPRRGARLQLAAGAGRGPVHAHAANLLARNPKPPTAAGRRRPLLAQQ